MSSSTSSDQVSSRSARLSKHFGQVLQGKRSVRSAADAKLYLEAICDQQEPSSCIEKLIASSQALESLRMGLRFDVSPPFINSTIAVFIKYLSDPKLKQLCNGQFLQQLLLIVAEPPTLWNAFFKSYMDRALTQDSVYSFAWLLLELLSLPAAWEVDVQEAAQRVIEDKTVFDSPSHEIRVLGHKIQHVLLIKSSNAPANTDCGPGGRHDNDFVDFRKIAIYPTADEFISSERPFYRRADAIEEANQEHRVAMHLDNQFRLLREDMLGELRNDFQIARGKKKGRRSALILRGLSLEGFYCGTDRRREPCALTLRCESGLYQLSNLTPSQRKTFVAETRNFLKHQSFGCLINGSGIVAFATVNRNEDLLIRDPPVVVLQISGETAFKKALLAIRIPRGLEFVLVDTPVFAYEPVLRCLQQKTELPLAEELLSLDFAKDMRKSSFCSTDIIQKIKDSGGHNLHKILKTPKTVNLDQSQMESLLAGLTQALSLIQGPPGTGKSFIGALLAKILHEHSEAKILVICYTNHALDQFLEDLLDIGIHPDQIVRLGAKSTPRTKCLNLSESSPNYRRSSTSWDLINKLKDEVNDQEKFLTNAFGSYQNSTNVKEEILEYLEFSEDDAHFYHALQTPIQGDGMTRVDRRGRAVGPYYLFDQWSRGRNAGVFGSSISQEHARVWEMDIASRQACMDRWIHALLQERVTGIGDLVQGFNRLQHRLEEVWNERNAEIIKQKRIIGCTTTAAAKYTSELCSASPGVILVEEAGEILESHILTAMTPETKQLVLIGDHQQLRPKVNNYALTVEKGDGYNLNRSLFERLVLRGFPHTVLTKQHRMCPEISSLVRHLTYPNLQDDPKTLSRPPIRGLQDRVIFFNHEHLEVETTDLDDRRDQGSKNSKQNIFEVEIVLKCVRYLAQQGYGTDKQVILTPYLGQLRLLRDHLSEENDPILNDLDSFDLVRAGLLSPASAKISKRPIRISTIDNYQGEESDIVIVTLTRSNKAADIGFMAAPQRLNVLLSRARNALIMIGNGDTFMNSRRSKESWVPFLHYLSQKGHLYNGFPVKCERHPDKKLLLQRKEDFETECPDGGCSDPCGTKLSCGLHDCPQRCHQLFDHSKVQCRQIVESVCSQNHKLSWQCFKQSSASCKVCDAEARRREEKRQRDYKLEAEREAKQKEYAQKLAEVQDEIAHERRLQRDRSEQNERDKVLRQHEKDLADLRAATKEMNIGKITPGITTPQQGRLSAKKSSPGNSRGSASDLEPAMTQDKGEAGPTFANQSPKDDWEYQKEFEGAQNETIDTLMGMIGLSDVKDQFLSIKARVDTVVRQNIDMKDERFSAALLGNPGTGKTTVARLYAKFLTSVGALPGSFVIETTGSRLANDGVAGCKKQIDDILNNGGGALFIDEAYQLASSHNYSGSQVLDFLLAEVENLTGKVVFILAGYNKQMEAFFAHNPGLPSRFPHELRFKDYEDQELLQILGHKIDKKYGGRMKVEGAVGGLYSRIVARRVGRGRGREGFGNARAVENAFADIARRQAKRLQRERRAGRAPDDLLLTKEDLLGPEPSLMLKDNASWSKLQSLIGLSTVKQSVQALFDSIQYNYCRELEENPLVEYSLNRVLVGSPGTGKTTVAKLYGQILADIGLLSSGEVVVKNPADFVGSVLGESEKNTKGILASTAGKVLVIDEAYGLYGGSTSGTGSQADPYKTAVIDTIVAEVQSTPGEDRCVLLLGYKDQMEQLFQKANIGLARRFPLDSAFVFEDFTDSELQEILNLKLKNQGFEATDQGKKVALEVLRRARNRPHFGNAGEVDILLNSAKFRHQHRLSSVKSTNSATLEARDFDEDFDRGERDVTNIRKLFQGVVGCEGVIAQLEGYQITVANMKARDMDPREQIPFNFLFRGPPGTGKTTTARRMGKVYYDMGFLATAEVVECSATELVGQYVGQTGPKTQELLRKALGKVLFIDEAYRLAEGQFAKEAMDEMVDCLTKPEFAQKLVTILAGYDDHINRLMSINPGLTSRFPEAVVFGDMSPDECLQLFTQLLQRKKNVEAAILENPSNELRQTLLQQFHVLSNMANWANARDIQTLVKSVFGKTIKSASPSQEILTVREEVIIKEIDSMISERAQRGKSTTADRYSSTSDIPQVVSSNSFDRPLTSQGARTNHTASQVKHSAPPDLGTEVISGDPPRDSGVSDAVWERLQVDKQAAEARSLEHKRLLKQERAIKESHAASKEKELAAETALQEEIKRKADAAAANEARRRFEEARLRHELERRAREAELEDLERKRKAAEEARRKEAEAQTKLRRMGVCCAGFRWIKQTSGYRCAGGSHFVSDAALE